MQKECRKLRPSWLVWEAKKESSDNSKGKRKRSDKNVLVHEFSRNFMLKIQHQKVINFCNKFPMPKIVVDAFFGAKRRSRSSFRAYLESRLK